MAVIDLKGSSVRSNGRFAEMLGSEGEIVASGVWKELLPPEWKSRKKTDWKDVPKGDFFRGHEARVRGKKGKSITVFVNGAVIEKKPDGNHTIFLSAVDVSGTRKGGEKLRETNERLAAKAVSLEKQAKTAKAELAAAKQEVHRTSKSFQKLNDNMKALISEFQDQKGDLENRIVSNFNLTVGPIVEHLKALNVPEIQKHLLDTLDFSIKNITSYFGINIGRQGANLSPREIQICQMIREGKDSREIAKTMGVSYQTVIVHRKNIRKKLGIKKVKQNLATYLQQNL